MKKTITVEDLVADEAAEAHGLEALNELMGELSGSEGKKSEQPKSDPPCHYCGAENWWFDDDRRTSCCQAG